ncbi:MAG TPA: AAA family ATPase [Pyrinomonadaceae bacterium]|nr:AAA family ATPase [Pyrinomonadaceae bacterium]
MKDIIIAGDWVVDEYWYLVRQHSEISSHTGFVHYRSSSKREDRILDLCSAGHVARVLNSLRSSSNDYHIWGIGDWNDGDTNQLLHLIHRPKPDCHANQANFLLNRPVCSEPPPGVTLLPLHKDRPTTRVVRLYHSTEDGIVQLSRIDWEQPPEEVKEKRRRNQGVLPTGLPASDKVGAIVIHDLCKGAITPQLIEQLNKHFHKARWYVRTKSQAPEWLDVIRDRIDLRLIGPEVAEPDNPWGSWLSGSENKITYQSYTSLRAVQSPTLILSEDREVIGRVSRGKKCITAKAQPPEEGITQVGWPSALLGVLVHKFHTTGSEWHKELFEEALALAHIEAGVPVDITPAAQPLLSVRPTAVIREWDTQEREWTSAMNQMGILSPEGSEPCLEVWRGASDLPGYVACIQAKRKHIIDIGKRLRAFIRTNDPIRSLSILLQADPGSGKSHLAKLLARKFKLSPLSFDISQMLHRDDLLDLFDAVATEQANREQRVLVIVDEINARLDNAPVYSSFLAPLEQNVYVRRGRVFSLKPCVWIFAGTGPEESERGKSMKISDFEERLTTTVKLDYPSLKAMASTDAERDDVRSKAKLEQVYLGASIIQQRYPDVEQVGLFVLKEFFQLTPTSSPARAIRKMVEEAHNVQRGKVTIQNIKDDGPAEQQFVRLIGKI